jgi:Predicted transcription factor, homolog of eukaryotic MBF1
MDRAKHEWIREGLQRRGYRQKDLAVAWGAQQASVSRFISGEELQDLQLSKAVTLARMLGISVDELAKGLGIGTTTAIEPQIESLQAPSMPLGTVNISSPRPGVTRLEMRKDFSVQAAQKILEAIATDHIPD